MKNQLKILRLSQDLTVEEVSEKVGVTKSMLYQIEGGYKKPSSKTAIKLAKIYKCTLDDIFLPKNQTDSCKN